MTGPVTKCTNAGACSCTCSDCKKARVYHCANHDAGCHLDCTPL